MMNKVELVDGIVEFIMKTMFPSLDGFAKWGVKTGLNAWKSRADGYLDKAISFCQSPAMAPMKLVDESGAIDIDFIHETLKTTMSDMPNPIYDTGEGTRLTKAIGRIVIRPQLIDELFSFLRKSKGMY